MFAFIEAPPRPTRTVTNTIRHGKTLHPLPTLDGDLVEVRSQCGQRWPITQRRMLIGKSAKADILLEHSDVIAEHAQLSARRGRLFIEALGADEDIFVNGVRTRRSELRRGSVVRIGDAILVVTRSTRRRRPADVPPQLSARPSLQDAVCTSDFEADRVDNVLIKGHVGSPYHFLARLLHERDRPGQPFVTVSCAATSRALLRAELLGESPADGAINRARGGTLFLDEVIAMPRSLQTLVAHRFEQTPGLARGVRIVSSTTGNVQRAIVADQLGVELYGWIARREVALPSLHERKEELRVEFNAYASDLRAAPPELSPDALEALMLHDWPVNERELQSCVAFSMQRSRDRVGLDDLPAPIRQRLVQQRRLSHRKRTPVEQRADVVGALRRHHGNVRRAAAEAGYSRSHFYRLIEKLSIDVDSFRDPVLLRS